MVTSVGQGRGRGHKIKKGAKIQVHPAQMVFDLTFVLKADGRLIPRRPLKLSQFGQVFPGIEKDILIVPVVGQQFLKQTEEIIFHTSDRGFQGETVYADTHVEVDPRRFPGFSRAFIHFSKDCVRELPIRLLTK